MIIGLNHYNLRASPNVIEELKIFYENMRVSYEVEKGYIFDC